MGSAGLDPWISGAHAVNRRVASFLDDWILAPGRKPLVMRGARQVGKTWLVRDLAKRHGRQLVEVNLERRPELAEHFRTNDARQATADLEAELGTPIRGPGTLLFLDEVQAAPHLLAFLRWLREDLPELPVVAAGSLLDFALRDHDFSMPVGRITYCYVEPVSFYEFLDAADHAQKEERFWLAQQVLTLVRKFSGRELAELEGIVEWLKRRPPK